MFETLSQRLTQTFRQMAGRGRLTEDNIQESLREVRLALLEADVALPVVKQFIDDIRARAVGAEVMKSLSPDQALVKIVNEELIKVLGSETCEINLNVTPPAVIMMVGLQGSGKTTSTAKLARHLKEVRKKSVLVTSVDIYRPAAIEQLKILAQEIGVDFHPSQTQQNPVDIAKAAILQAKHQAIDVVIIDTAGRLHVDDAMMKEMQEIQTAINPIETLLVVDAMTGQDAAKSAQAFDQAVKITGIILSKIDGDARGGAALSIKSLTGKSLKFIGVGEKTDQFEVFHPDRIASRILGMGDVLSLIEEAQQKLDHDKANQLAKKLKKGKSFDLEDFRDQLQQMDKMGGMMGLIGKIPGFGALPQNLKDKVDGSVFKRIEAMINSMTPQERRFPDIIRASRKQRIAAGSGTQVQDINRMLKQFEQMQKMVKKMSSPGKMAAMMRQMQGMMPPGGGAR